MLLFYFILLFTKYYYPLHINRSTKHINRPSTKTMSDLLTLLSSPRLLMNLHCFGTERPYNLNTFYRTLLDILTNHLKHILNTKYTQLD